MSEQAPDGNTSRGVVLVIDGDRGNKLITELGLRAHNYDMEMLTEPEEIEARLAELAEDPQARQRIVALAIRQLIETGPDAFGIYPALARSGLLQPGFLVMSLSVKYTDGGVDGNEARDFAPATVVGIRFHDFDSLGRKIDEAMAEVITQEKSA